MNTTNPMIKASELGRAIWKDLWPHQELAQEYPTLRHEPEARPSDDVRLALVTRGGDVAPGDLILVATPRSPVQWRFTSTHTVREAMEEQWTYVALVEASTAKTLTIRPLEQTPRNGWACDLERFGDVPEGSPSMRIRVDAPSRTIGRLGSVAEIRGRIAAHLQFGEWRAAFSQAVDAHAEYAARAQASHEREKAQWQPVEEAVQKLNAMACEDLLSFLHGEVRFTAPWLAEKDRLGIYLAGLNAVGQLTDGQLTQALELLTTIGL
ncbi:hypothetical protein [Streptomyces goshikiensis]|uniref:hypothetical protein n=1 Tax=Streptomyces goshikiensis TaxID=1942 RepID=UPI00368C5A7F